MLLSLSDSKLVFLLYWNNSCGLKSTNYFKFNLFSSLRTNCCSQIVFKLC